MIFKIEKKIAQLIIHNFNECMIKRRIGLAETHLATKLNFHIK